MNKENIIKTTVSSQTGNKIMTNTSEIIKIFVGSEIGNEKAEKALHWSIINTSTHPVEVNWMSDIYSGSVWDGWNKGRDHRKQDTGQGWKTNFSAFRWAIPELCGFKGKAIYLDVDQIVIRDMKKMWELPLGDYAAIAISPERTDVMLMECEKFSGDGWPRIKDMKPSGKSQKSYRKLVDTKFGIGPLDKIYNCLDGDGWDSSQTRLVHYTKMSTQPWRPFAENLKYSKHAVPELEVLWKEYYSNALDFQLKHEIAIGAPHAHKSLPIIFGNITSQVADYPKSQ
jgi:hypothetical protein